LQGSNRPRGSRARSARHERKDKKLQDSPRANLQSCQELLPPLSMGEQGGGGGRSGPNRRCHGGLGAQVSHGIERGDRGGLEDVLTGGGEEGERPDFESQRRRFASLPARAGRRHWPPAAGAALGGGRRSWGMREGRRRRRCARAQPPLLWGRALEPLAAAQSRPPRPLADGWMGPAGPGGWAGADWAFGLGPFQ
jgi:hypothetical protein